MGFRGRDIGRESRSCACGTSSPNLSYPVIAVFLLAVGGAVRRVLATAAFVGAAVLGIAVAALAAVLASRRAAAGIGELAAQLADWALGKFRRGPVSWGGESFERFRLEATDLLGRRWHALTLATYAGTLTVFLVLLVSLREFDVSVRGVGIEAFARGSLPALGRSRLRRRDRRSQLASPRRRRFVARNAEVVAAVLVYRPDDGADHRCRSPGRSIFEAGSQARDRVRVASADPALVLRSAAAGPVLT